MNGPEHHHFADQLAQEAYNRLGQGDEQSATAWAAVAQVHATLALAAATAGTTGVGSRASAEGAEPEPDPFPEHVEKKPHRGRSAPARKLGQGQ